MRDEQLFFCSINSFYVAKIRGIKKVRFPADLAECIDGEIGGKQIHKKSHPDLQSGQLIFTNPLKKILARFMHRSHSRCIFATPPSGNEAEQKSYPACISLIFSLILASISLAISGLSSINCLTASLPCPSLSLL